MIEDLLPAEVASVELYGDDPSAFLLAEEAAQFGSAVESRMKEFTSARSCARRALSKLGLAQTPILRGANREPLWPPGVVGSITHCKGFRAASVAKKSDLLAIGIDAEVHEALPPEVFRYACTDQELCWLAGAPEGTHWDKVLFSAKESVYKAWFPLTQRWLGFEDVAVTLHPVERKFLARVLIDAPVIERQPLAAFSGHFLVRHGLVLTATLIPRLPGVTTCHQQNCLPS